MRSCCLKRNVIIYDGDCEFCRRQVDRIHKKDRAGRFELLPKQHPDLLRRLPQLSGADLSQGLRLVTPAGRVYVGADAVHQIARELPGWRLLAWVYCVPGLRQLLRAGYASVATHRQSLSRNCPTGTCAAPPPRQRTASHDGHAA